MPTINLTRREAKHLADVGGCSLPRQCTVCAAIEAKCTKALERENITEKP